MSVVLSETERGVTTLTLNDEANRNALGPDLIEGLMDAIEAADADPAVVAAMERVDCSADEHRTAEMLLLQTAGFDEEFATAFYDLLGRPDTHPVYPEVESVLRSLRSRGVAIGVISDIHVDLRDHARAAGIADLVDAWTLSYELGVQKPDPAIYEHALTQLGTRPADTLMVGDRHTADGAASLLGIDCLILPARGRDAATTDSRLDGVVRLVG